MSLKEELQQISRESLQVIIQKKDAATNKWWNSYQPKLVKLLRKRAKEGYNCFVIPDSIEWDIDKSDKLYSWAEKENFKIAKKLIIW